MMKYAVVRMKLAIHRSKCEKVSSLNHNTEYSQIADQSEAPRTNAKIEPP